MSYADWIGVAVVAVTVGTGFILFERWLHEHGLSAVRPPGIPEIPDTIDELIDRIGRGR